MVTKIYNLQVMVIDHDKRHLEHIIQGLENCKYVWPSVMRGQSAEISDWGDDHPLNKTTTSLEAFDLLFEDKIGEAQAEYVKALDLEIDFA